MHPVQQFDKSKSLVRVQRPQGALTQAIHLTTDHLFESSSAAVNGQWELPTDGHETSPPAVTRIPH
jgi:hypothetical protein